MDTAEKQRAANNPQPLDPEDAIRHPGCDWPEFDTRADAYDRGYEGPKVGKVTTHNGYEVRVVDNSGGSDYGYTYAVMAFPSVELIRAGHSALGPFGATVNVGLSKETNRLNRLGAVTAMWKPGALDRAVREARAAIDASLKLG